MIFRRIYSKKNSLREKGNKNYINKNSNLFKCKSNKRENNTLFYLVNLFIIYNLLLCILSDISIKIKAYFSNTNYDYPIINVQNIGHPSEIYVDSEKIQTKKNLKYKYLDGYLYIKTINKIGNYIIKLVWKSEITMNNTLISDDNDDDEYIESSDFMFEDNSSNEINLFEEIKEETELIQEEEYNIIPENFSLNGFFMFYNCACIKTINFYDFDTTIIYNMSNMFRFCTLLTEIKNFSPVNVQDMSYLFYKCVSLTKVNFIFLQSMYSKLLI